MGNNNKSMNFGLLNARDLPVAVFLKKFDADSRVAITNFIWRIQDEVQRLNN